MNTDSAFLPAMGVVLLAMLGMDHVSGGMLLDLVSSFLSQNGF